MQNATLISQGSELICGDVLDTNTQWIAQQLKQMGIQTSHHLTVGDHPEHISNAFQQAISFSNLVICAGGLGPTQDDHTFAALANALNTQLKLFPEVLSQIEAFYHQLNRPMPQSNRKQAYLPIGSTVHANQWGTAPAISLWYKSCLIICLPGPPHELKALFVSAIQALLQRHFGRAPQHPLIARVFGLGESTIQEKLRDLPDEIEQIAYCAQNTLVTLSCHLKAPPSAHAIQVVSQWLTQALGRSIYSLEHPGELACTLQDVIAQLLTQGQQSLCTAESCTGGQLAALCTSVPGSSTWFISGVVSYSNHSKVRLLHVQEGSLIAQGAVSKEVCIQMATGARLSNQSDFALATTGIAGPGGYSKKKPLGLVHIALATPHTTLHQTLSLHGSRAQIQAATCLHALALLLNHLQPQ